MCGHVAIMSDATAAIGMVHRLAGGKVRHLAVGDLWGATSCSFKVSKMSGLENPSDAQTKFLGTGTIVAPHKSLQLGPCRC